MHTRWAMLPSVILSVGTISTLLLAVGLQWGFAAEEESVDLHGWVRNAEGRAVTRLGVRCTDSQEKIVRTLFPDENGKFTLHSIPKSIKTIACAVNPDHLGQYNKPPAQSIPVEADNSMAFMLDFRLPVKKLEAWIIAPKGWKLEDAWMEVTQYGKTFGFFAKDAQPNPEKENLKLITSEGE